jgi:hypothetical protein
MDMHTRARWSLVNLPAIHFNYGLDVIIGTEMDEELPFVRTTRAAYVRYVQSKNCSQHGQRSESREM